MYNHGSIINFLSRSYQANFTLIISPLRNIKRPLNKTKIPNNDYHAKVFISNHCQISLISRVSLFYPFFIRRVLQTPTIKFIARESKKKKKKNEIKLRSPVIKSSVLARFFQQSSPSIERKWRISPSSQRRL